MDSECALYLSSIPVQLHDSKDDVDRFTKNWNYLSEKLKESNLVFDLLNVLSGLESSFFTWSLNRFTGGYDVVVNPILSKDFDEGFFEMCSDILDIRLYQNELVDFVNQSQKSFICQSLSEEILNVLDDLQQSVSKFHDRHVQSLLSVEKLFNYLKPAKQTLSFLSSVVTGYNTGSLLYDKSNLGVVIIDHLVHSWRNEVGLKKELLQHLLNVCLESYFVLIKDYIAYSSVNNNVCDFFIKYKDDEYSLDNYKQLTDSDSNQDVYDEDERMEMLFNENNGMKHWLDRRYVPKSFRKLSVQVFGTGVYLRLMKKSLEYELIFRNMDDLVSDMEKVYKHVSDQFYQYLKKDCRIFDRFKDFFDYYLFQKSDYISEVIEEMMDNNYDNSNSNNNYNRSMNKRYHTNTNNSNNSNLDNRLNVGRFYLCYDNMKNLTDSLEFYKYYKNFNKFYCFDKLNGYFNLTNYTDLGNKCYYDLDGNYDNSNFYNNSKQRNNDSNGNSSNSNNNYNRSMDKRYHTNNNNNDDYNNCVDFDGENYFDVLVPEDNLDYRNLVLCFDLDEVSRLVFTNKIVYKYKLLFKLLFQLKYAEYWLNQVSLYHVKSSKMAIHPELVSKFNLQLFTVSKMQLFVKSVLQYFLVDVVMTNVSEFMSNSYVDFVSLYTNHEKLVDSMFNLMFLKDSELVSVLQKILLVLVKFSTELMKFLNNPDFSLYYDDFLTLENSSYVDENMDSSFVDMNTDLESLNRFHSFESFGNVENHGDFRESVGVNLSSLRSRLEIDTDNLNSLLSNTGYCKMVSLAKTEFEKNLNQFKSLLSKSEYSLKERLLL